MEIDPIKVTENTILKNKIATEDEIASIKASIKEEIAAAVRFAEESNFPPGSELYSDNYLQKDYPFMKD